MSIITAGNEINFGSPFNNQGTLWGPLVVIQMMGYVDIPPTNVAGPLPWIIDNPARNRADISGIVLPNPHRLLGVGIKVPAVNRQRQTANLIGTDTATFRNGNASNDAGGAIVTFAGTTQGATEVMVPTPFPSATASAPTYQFHTSANIRSSRGTLRLFGYVCYAVSRRFPNDEMLMQTDAVLMNP